MTRVAPTVSPARFRPTAGAAARAGRSGPRFDPRFDPVHAPGQAGGVPPQPFSNTQSSTAMRSAHCASSSIGRA